jgi:quercetin dioxygenase-like cupin family protein
MSEALGTDALQINVLFFEPGVRSRPHTHPYDQVLYYVSGKGVVAIEGGEDQIVEAGEFVLLPPSVPHMHGASEDGPACHISLMREVETDFDCPIPESWQRWQAEPSSTTNRVEP